MPKGYWIAHLTTTDAANYPKYKDAASGPIAAFGGKFIVRGGRHELPEGSGRDRDVVVEFASFEQALACYRSPAYQEAVKMRQTWSDSSFVIVEGAE